MLFLKYKPFICRFLSSELHVRDIKYIQICIKYLFWGGGYVNISFGPIKSKINFELLTANNSHLVQHVSFFFYNKSMPNPRKYAGLQEMAFTRSKWRTINIQRYLLNFKVKFNYRLGTSYMYYTC